MNHQPSRTISVAAPRAATAAAGKAVASVGLAACPKGGPLGHDRHECAMWDAAYVLGSLSVSDRRKFEDHLSGCASCRQAVAELSDLPALLGLLDRDQVACLGQVTLTSNRTVARPIAPIVNEESATTNHKTMKDNPQRSSTV